MNDLELAKIERDDIANKKAMYQAKQYEQLLDLYCHEGVEIEQLSDNRWSVRVCSHGVTRQNRDRAIREVADWVYQRLHEGRRSC